MEENKTVATETENTTTGVDYAAEYARLKEENEKLRKANTSASADASKYKKELASRLSESERVERERAEAAEALQNELAEANRKLEEATKREAIANATSAFAAIGYAEALAKSSAEAFLSGDGDKFFSDLKAFIAEHDKQMIADDVRKTPKPVSGNGGTEVSAEQFAKMGYNERVNLYNTNPELYKILNS